MQDQKAVRYSIPYIVAVNIGLVITIYNLVQ